jgi:AraC family transcriptional regulator
MMDVMALARPRIEIGKSLLMAGFRQSHRASETDREIPRQWRRLWPYLGSLPNQVGSVSFGVVCESSRPGHSDYMCAIEVDDFSDLPPELDRMRFPQQTYAIFSHDGNVTSLQETRKSILEEWYPQSGLEAATTPDFERYGESFDPVSGEGDMEIWFPVKS